MTLMKASSWNLHAWDFLKGSRLFRGFPQNPFPLYVRTVFQARHKSDFGLHPQSLGFGGKWSSQVGDWQLIPQGLRLPAHTLRGNPSGLTQYSTPFTILTVEIFLSQILLCILYMLQYQDLCTCLDTFYAPQCHAMSNTTYTINFVGHTSNRTN